MRRRDVGGFSGRGGGGVLFGRRDVGEFFGGRGGCGGGWWWWMGGVVWKEGCW